VGTAGNVSVRLEDQVAVTATGVDLASCTAADVTVVDRSGRVVLGDLEPTSELDLHLGVYATHAPLAVGHARAGATALRASSRSCPASTSSSCSWETVGWRRTPTSHPELATSVVAALEGRQAALLAYHGSVTSGAGLERGRERAAPEWLCEGYRTAVDRRPKSARRGAAAGGDQRRSERQYGHEAGERVAGPMTNMNVVAWGVQSSTSRTPRGRITGGIDGAIVDVIAMPPPHGRRHGCDPAGSARRCRASARSEGLARRHLVGCEAAGVDPSHLVGEVLRRPGERDPVRPNGDRPAWHCIGTNGVTRADVDLDVVAAATHLHWRAGVLRR